MKHILIIEDDPNTLSGLIELLSDEGYAVYGATQGSKAIELLELGPIDIVLCDYSLPDIDGIQLCYKLKRIRPELTVFLTTAYYNAYIRKNARKCGIARIFTKPFVLDELLKTIFLHKKNDFKSIVII